MRKFRFKQKLVRAAVCVFCVVLAALLVFSALYVRRTVISYAENTAESMVFRIANDVISEQINDKKISYNDIVRLNRNAESGVTSLETDVVKINSLKSAISSEIEKAVSNTESVKIGIPVGTLFGNEYTVGLGPKLYFNMQLSATAVTDFKSNFYSAGINQVLHQILITVKINGSLVLPWAQSGFSADTTVIAAQTVLVGSVPDAYTNVDETTFAGEPQVVGDIFDYSAKTQ